MVLRIILEGLLLVLFCAAGIRKGAVNMVFLYHPDVQERSVSNGLITRERIRKNAALLKGVGIPVYKG